MFPGRSTVYTGKRSITFLSKISCPNKKTASCIYTRDFVEIVLLAKRGTKSHSYVNCSCIDSVRDIFPEFSGSFDGGKTLTSGLTSGYYDMKLLPPKIVIPLLGWSPQKPPWCIVVMPVLTLAGYVNLNLSSLFAYQVLIAAAAAAASAAPGIWNSNMKTEAQAMLVIAVLCPSSAKLSFPVLFPKVYSILHRILFYIFYTMLIIPQSQCLKQRDKYLSYVDSLICFPGKEGCAVICLVLGCCFF